MRKQDFQFDLPEELIAQRPTPDRAASRLLVVDRAGDGLDDHAFLDLPEFLRRGDLLVFNDTRVIPARLYGNKASGGRVEVLIERLENDAQALAQVRSSKAPKPGTDLMIGPYAVKVEGRRDGFFELRCEDPGFEVLMTGHGHVPLPPYIDRDDDDADLERYQTVYAKRPGAVAAPTAGLHFTEALLDRLAADGVEHGFVALHVGAGTFQPMRVDEVAEHTMHRERVEVGADLCERIADTRRRGGRIIAVGTTSLRSLEAAWVGGDDGAVEPFDGETDIFIHPGIPVRSIDGLLTNFHLPESTLLMLVCALAGTQRMLGAYRHAVEQRYRFFSYGDAMLIL